MRQLDQLGARDAGGKLARQSGWCRGVAQADDHERQIADRGQIGAAIELGERAAGGREVLRLGGAQARLALLGNRGMRGQEVVREHALQRLASTASMPPFSTRSAMPWKPGLPSGGIAAPVSTSTSLSNSL